MTTCEEVKKTFLQRSAVLREIRSFFHERGYVEVETPMMQAIPGGAAAQPFKTHHNALGCEFYLRIALELYLKRLLVGGIGMFAVLPFIWRTPQTLRALLFFCSLGVIGAVGHYLVARAFTNAPANIVSPFQYFQLPKPMRSRLMVNNRYKRFSKDTMTPSTPGASMNKGRYQKVKIFCN